MEVVLLLIRAIPRLACIGFLVVAALTIPEAWNLIQDETFAYTQEGSTAWVPLQTCFALDYTSTGNTNLDETNTNCHSLEYFINASVASMFFTGVAILLFIVFDIMSRYCTGPISRASVSGMSLFLAFLLIQTAACTYAIYNECQYWVSFYEQQFAALGRNDVEEVRTYANKFLFFLTSIMALACAGLLLIDSVVGFCVGPTPKGNKTANEEEYVAPAATGTSTVAADSHDYTMEYDVATPEQPSQEPNTRSWTSY